MNKQRALASIKKRLPTLCVALSAVMGAAALYFTGKATVQAVRRYDELKKDDPELDKKTLFKAVVPYYIPAIGFAATSLTLSIAGNTISARRNRVLALAAISAQEALRDFKTKAKEVVGEEKIKEVEKELSYDAKLIPSTHPDPDIIVYDVYAQFKIPTTLKTLYEAEAKVNEILSDSAWTSSHTDLKTFYEALGVSSRVAMLLPEAYNKWDAFHMIHHNETNWVTFTHEDAFDKNGQPMVILRYYPEPVTEQMMAEQMI